MKNCAFASLKLWDSCWSFGQGKISQNRPFRFPAGKILLRNSWTFLLTPCFKSFRFKNHIISGVMNLRANNAWRIVLGKASSLLPIGSFRQCQQFMDTEETSLRPVWVELKVFLVSSHMWLYQNFRLLIKLNSCSIVRTIKLSKCLCYYKEM